MVPATVAEHPQVTFARIVPTGQHQCRKTIERTPHVRRCQATLARIRHTPPAARP